MKIKLTALAAVLALSASVHAAVDYDAGDLVMSFYSKTGTGSTQNVSVSLGDLASAFRGDLLGTTGLSSSSYWTSAGSDTFTFNLGTTLGDILSDTFGSDWYTSGNVSWGIVGLYSNSAAANGDPRRTVYVSHAASDPSYSVYSSTAQSAAGYAKTFLDTFNSMEADPGQTLVATYGDGDSNSYESWQYGGSNSATSDWNSGFTANASVGTSLGLDRLLSYAATSPAGTAGEGQLVGTFSLSSDGALTFSAVPEPSTYGLLIGGVLALGFIMWKRRRVAV